jgi:hypothetical protein
MNPDIKWLEALKLPLKSSLAGAVIAPAILLSITKNWIDFGGKAELASTVLVIATIIFTVMSLVGVGELLLKPVAEKQKKKSIIDRRKIRRNEELAIRADNEIRILRRLDSLSEEELAVFAEQIQKNSATFYSWFHSPHLGSLMHKGLISAAQGAYNQDHFPFIIHDFVWDELLKRKDEFLGKSEEAKNTEGQKKRKATFDSLRDRRR